MGDTLWYIYEQIGEFIDQNDHKRYEAEVNRDEHNESKIHNLHHNWGWLADKLHNFTEFIRSR